MITMNKLKSVINNFLSKNSTYININYFIYQSRSYHTYLRKYGKIINQDYYDTHM